MKETIKEFVDFVLYVSKWVLIVAIIVLINIGSNLLDHKIRQVAQHNETLHEIVMVTDAMSFMTGGGGPIGYKNYYKWQYAKWRADPERTWFEKAMFWNGGILYDASDPPDEYQYPFLGKK